MAWRLSQALMTLRSEVNAEHPDRSTISDGTIGDLAHSVRTSDHNPDANGLVHAWDVTADPEHGVAQRVVDFLTTGKPDPRLKYVIWQRRIYSRKWGIWAWRRYTGKNPHDHHAHVSVTGDDGAAWGYGTDTWTPPAFPGVIQRGSTPQQVAAWRVVLGALGYKGFKVGVHPWSTTLGAATRRFQRRHGLKPDGIVGPKTWAKAIERLTETRQGKG